MWLGVSVDGYIVSGVEDGVVDTIHIAELWLPSVKVWNGHW